MSVFYIDCEFDGHNGGLLSFAIVRDDGDSLHIRTDHRASDPWVIENVMSVMEMHRAKASITTDENGVGPALLQFIGKGGNSEIVADSPVDIARFCKAISTDENGNYAPCAFDTISFRVRDVDCYPTPLIGAVRHNAWWDAMALKELLE